MSEISWRRAALLLLAADARGAGNLLRDAPGKVAVGALVPFSVALVTLFPFAFVVSNVRGQGAEIAVAAGLAFMILAGFGPPRWSASASALLPTLPVSDRAVFAHATLRTFVAATLGYLYAMLPLVVIVAMINVEATADVAVFFWPLAAAGLLGFSIGRTAWGVLADAAPAVQWAARIALLAWFSMAPLAALGGVPLEGQPAYYGPLFNLAQYAAAPYVVFFLQTPDRFAATALALAVACLLPLVVPVRSYPARPQGPQSDLFGISEGRARARSVMPRAAQSFRRILSPFPIPAGPEWALRYMARQWLKAFLWILILYGLYTAFLNVVALAAPRPDPVPGPVRPFPWLQLFTAVYLVALAGVALVNSPEVLERLAGLRGRRADAFAIPVPALLRIGPPVLSFKRWTMLQTMPFSRGVMHRAFLRPLALYLAFVVLALVALLGALTRYNVQAIEGALFIGACILIIVGGYFVGSRAAHRHARAHSLELEGLHTLGAALWTAGILPLLLVGVVWFVTRFTPEPFRPPGVGVAFFAFAVAAFVMPVAAYYFAWERLVAVDRPYESSVRVAALLAGAVLFFVVPSALLVIWWSPNV